ncbi:helix-turn-helix domain-containing protein [Nocardioides pocheonensis]|uniref:Helix-turn-helix domain-containing protein n=1 Tax=Nocardioides pocheonensis TaxID=661485 RepID=A0A3N0GWG1_9ACTN|nr:helix-turn-helix domain-containing protein [Nocardioides pocheonensis]RNM16781.1 helix-turn-helix domain-containing protein [Nocardioides pocheonensis]
MTATAATEIDVLDFDAHGTGGRWERALSDVVGPVEVPLRQRRDDAVHFRTREVGDLQLVDWDCLSLDGALSLGEARDAQRDVVVVLAGLPGDDGDGFTPQKRIVRRALALPRTVLVAAGCDANIPARLVLEQDRPLVGVLLMVLDEVWSRRPAMSAREVEAAREALVTLTAGVIRAERGSVTPRAGLPALRAQLDDWITDNLRSGPIRIEDLAAAHNVSARTVVRAFSLTGDTMMAVVRARRLAAVRDDLVHTDMTIATIAHRWCYYDPSHLGREFRRHFGVSPTEYREHHGC